MFGLFEKKSLAFSLSDHSFYALALKGEPKTLVIESLIQQALPPSVMANGIIKEPALLTDIIKKSFLEAKPSPLKQKEAVFILPEELTYEYTFMLSKDIKPADIDNAIQQQLSSRIPIAFNEAIYDYTLTTSLEGPIISAVLVSKAHVQTYCDFFRSLHITLTALEPESVSLLRNIEIPQSDNGLILLVFRKNTTLNWFLFLGGILLESSISSMADLETFATDVSKTVSQYSKKMNKPLDRIILSGSMIESEQIASVIEKALKKKPEVKNKFKISISEIKSSSDQFKTENYVFSKLNIMLGACLRNYEKKDKKQLNLLQVKKNSL